MPTPKRIAILGFSLETNAFAPVCDELEFRERGLYYGAEINDAARRPNPIIGGGICGFYKIMDERQSWEPVPIVFAAAHPNGPAAQPFFDHLLATMRDGLNAGGKLDGVYICEHGAGLATKDDDPDGTIFSLVRAAVGPDVPVIATLDLHANVSKEMLGSTDVMIAYLTNPHVDSYERGVEAAECMIEMLAGARPKAASVLPWGIVTKTSASESRRFCSVPGFPHPVARVPALPRLHVALQRSMLPLCLRAGFSELREPAYRNRVIHHFRWEWPLFIIS